MKRIQLAVCTLAMALLSAPVFAQVLVDLGPMNTGPVPSEPSDKRFRVTGRVIDDLTGKPLSGATVTLTFVLVHSPCGNCGAQPPAPQPPPPREVVTGSDGSFAFADVPVRAISIHAQKADYMDVWPIRHHAGDSLGTSFPGNRPTSFVIRLAPAASISGVLRHHDGTPVTKEQAITLMRLGQWAGWPRLDYGGWPKYAGDGSYSFQGLPPGRYYLAASLGFYMELPERMEGDRAFGEVPVRYPARTGKDPQPFFTLREGEHVTVDLQLPEAPLHHVIATSNPAEPASLVGWRIFDANGGIHQFHWMGGDGKAEAWLPNGVFTMDEGASGPTPFEVKDADLSDLTYTLTPQDSDWVKVPVEAIYTPPESAAAPPAIPFCLSTGMNIVRIRPGGYTEVANGASFNIGPGCPASHQQELVRLREGGYTVAFFSAGNGLYAKSVQSGSTDLALGPLSVHRGETPQPIRIEFAEGASVEGVVRLNSKPVRAWVYALAKDIETKTDFRLFNPAFAAEDGKFRLNGLTPGSYYFFASDVELKIDIHDPVQTAYWRSHGKVASVAAGETIRLGLEALNPPDSAAAGFN